MDISTCREVFNVFPEAIFIVDLNGKVRIANQAACKLLKRGRDEMQSSHLADLIDDAQIKPFNSRLKIWSNSRQASPAKFRFLIAGDYIPVHCLGSLFSRSSQTEPAMVMLRIKTEQKNHSGFASLNKKIKQLEQEVSHRRVYEKALIDSEAQVRLLLDSTGDAIFGLDLEGNCTFANKACLGLLGYTDAKAVLGRCILERLFSPCGKSNAFNKELREVHAQGKAVTIADIHFANINGECFPVECSIHPILHGNKHLGSVITFQDVSDKKAIEEALSRSQKSLEQAQSIAHLGSWEWDLKQDQMYWSDEVYRILEVSPSNFEPDFEKFIGFIPERQRQEVKGIVSNFAHQIDYELNIEHKVITNSGQVRMVNQRGKTHFDAAGIPTKIFGSIQDITDKKAVEEEIRILNSQLEQRVESRTKELNNANVALTQSLEDLRKTQNKLVESEKMAALGGLVAGVAHEINTPVGVGVTAASHLEQKLKKYRNRYQDGKLTVEDFESLMDSSEKACELVLHNLQRASNLIKSFKKIAVDQTSDELRELHLSEYIQEVIQSLTPKIKILDPLIEIKSDAEIRLYTHPGAFSQIITNFIMNSLTHGFDEHMDAGQRPKITIELSKSDKQVLVKYKDNGKGIAKDKFARVFEPFYTTKRDKGGSGLGMHIVYNLVTQTLDGSISLDSELGSGVEFEIIIPANK